MSNSNNYVLITGATGFLGGCTSAQILQSNEASRYLFLIRAGNASQGLERLRQSMRRFGVAENVLDSLQAEQILLGDLGQTEYLSDTRLDEVTHVINCAAIASFSNHPGIWPVNVDGTFAFAERMARAPKLRRFVHVGTAMACGPDRAPPIAESHDLAEGEDHLVPYTASKAEIERMMRARLPQLPLVIARPSIVVGHTQYGCTPSASIFWVFRMALSLEKFTCDLDERVDVVPVDYCAHALRLLTFKATLNHDLYHISSGEHRSNSFYEIDAAYAKANGSSAVAPRYRKIALADIRGMVEEFRARLGECNRKLVAKAVRLYGGFAELNYVFDNSRLIAEGLFHPPRFTDYIGECVRTSIDVPLATQMMEDFK